MVTAFLAQSWGNACDLVALCCCCFIYFFFSTFTIPSSVATFLLLARSYCYRSLVVSVQDQNWYHTRFLFDTTKSLVIRNRRIRHADCKIANLASVQTNRGSARVLGTRGDSCCLFCVEHLVSIHWQGEKAFPGPITKCFVSLIFLAVCMGLNTYTYMYIYELVTWGLFNSKLCLLQRHAISDFICLL